MTKLSKQNSNFQRWSDKGFSDYLIPIIPPCAEISVRSKIGSQSLGKVPGKYHPNSGTWSGYSGWSDVRGTQELIVTWDSWPMANIGLRTGNLVAIDIDLEDESWVNHVGVIAFKILGLTCIRSRNNSARVCLLYRGDFRRFKKVVTIFGEKEKPERGVTRQAVEILLGKNQIVVEGAHKTGALLEWDKEPVYLELPEVTVDQLYSFISELNKYVDSLGLDGSKHGSLHKRGDTVKTAVVSTQSGDIEIPDDSVLRVLYEKQLIQGEVEKGVYQITCPWFREHTGEDKSGTRYLLAHYNGHAEPKFWCNHAHCINSRFYSDLRTYCGVCSIGLLEVRYRRLPLPLHVLPQKLRAASEEIARVLKVPIEAVVDVYLCWVSRAMGNRVRIFEKADHDIFASLGFIIGMQAGERKSAIFKLIEKYHIEDVKEAVLSRFQKEKTEITLANKYYRKQLVEFDSTNVKPNTKEFEKVVINMAKNESLIRKVPEKPVLFTDNATDEAIDKLLAHNGGELGVFSPEFRAGLDNIAGRYAKGDATGEASILRGISNDSRSNSRVGSGHSETTNVALTLCGMVQPDKIFKLLGNPALSGSGFLGRIIFDVPDPLVGTRQEEENEVPLNTAYLDDMHQAVVRAFQCSSMVLKLSNEAAGHRRKFFNKLETAQGKDGKYELYSEVVNKMASISVKIAAIFWVIENPDKITNDAMEYIDGNQMACAITYTEILLENNLSFIKHKHADAVVEVAKTCLRIALEKHGVSKEFSMAALKRDHFSGSRLEFVEPALDLLVEHKFLSYQRQKKSDLYKLTHGGHKFYVDEIE